MSLFKFDLIQYEDELMEEYSDLAYETLEVLEQLEYSLNRLGEMIYAYEVKDKDDFIYSIRNRVEKTRVPDIVFTDGRFEPFKEQIEQVETLSGTHFRHIATVYRQ